MGQIEKFRGSSINGDSEHFTVLKEDEWDVLVGVNRSVERIKSFTYKFVMSPGSFRYNMISDRSIV